MTRLLETSRISGEIPFVSIGMPVFNGEKTICRALDSLLSQDHQNFELIVSDNASTDQTWKILQYYQSKEPRIKLFRQEQNIGSANNFRFVLDQAQGKYFMWVADDDYWQPSFVSSMVDELEVYPTAGVAMSAVDLIRDDGEQLSTVRFNGNDDPNHKKHYQMLIALTGSGRMKRKYNFYIYGLFRREILKEAMNYYIDTFMADRLFMCQMALITRFRYIDQPLHVRTIHPIPIYTRRPNEVFSQVFNKGRWVRFQPVFHLGCMLWNSSLIPSYRKLWIPVAMWRMSLLILRHAK